MQTKLESYHPLSTTAQKQWKLIKYCASDVNILSKACLKFRSIFMIECNVCPFTDEQYEHILQRNIWIIFSMLHQNTVQNLVFGVNVNLQKVVIRSTDAYQSRLNNRKFNENLKTDPYKAWNVHSIFSGSMLCLLL